MTRAQASPRTGPSVVHFAEIDGTNAEALRRAEEGAGEQWILADVQSAGRGRRGRSWTGLKGDLLATRLLHVDAVRPTGRPATDVSFIAALAVHEAISGFLDARRVTLKWPNDVLVDEAKIAGVLSEARKAPDGGLRLAVGFGINIVNRERAAGRPTIALHSAGARRDVTRERVFDALRRAFEARLTAWSGDGFEPVRRAWLAVAHGFGARVRVEAADGPREGKFTDLRADGALILKTAQGRAHAVTAGDVSLITDETKKG